jgi:hypothetical protein
MVRSRLLLGSSALEANETVTTAPRCGVRRAQSPPQLRDRARPGKAWRFAHFDDRLDPSSEHLIIPSYWGLRTSIFCVSRSGSSVEPRAPSGGVRTIVEPVAGSRQHPTSGAGRSLGMLASDATPIRPSTFAVVASSAE